MMSYDEFVERRDDELMAKYDRVMVKEYWNFNQFSAKEYEVYARAYLDVTHKRKEEELLSGSEDPVSDFNLLECEPPF